MKKTASSSEEILLIDKKGFLGELLVEKLAENKTIVLVSEKLNFPTQANDVLHFIRYKKKFPQVPRISYSKIIVVFNGEKEVKEIFFELAKAAEYVKARIILVVPLPLFNKEEIDKLLEFYNRLFVVILGNLFGAEVLESGLPIYREAAINQLLEQAVKDERILLAENGLANTYPVFVDDAVSAITNVVFSSHKSRIFNLFSKYPLTILSLARLIQKEYPQVSIDFSPIKSGFSLKKEQKKKIQEFPLTEEYLEISDMESGIKKTLKELFVKKKEKKKDNNIRTEINQGNSWQRIFLSGVFFILILFILPFLTVLFLSLFSVYELNAAKNDLEQGNFIAANKSAENAKTGFALAKSFSGIVLFKEFFLEKLLEGESFSEAASYFTSSVNSFTKVFYDRGSEKDFTAATVNLREALIGFQKIEAGGLSLPVSFLNSSAFNILNTFTLSAFDIFPSLFGLTEERQYAVFFQNNMELRPGGGFIGSYGILKIRRAKVLSFSIHDVYDADGQLKGHIEPPYPIRRYLPSVHWYLRDSNFDPDFTKGASASAFFLKNETGEKIDGIIAVDVSFVKELLKVLGSVYVPDYRETVTSDNLYLLTQAHAEKQFFPGSTQKKDFLRSLFNAIQLSFFAQDQSFKKVSYIKLLEAVSNAVLQKHLLFAFSNQSAADVFTVNKMSSSLVDNREENNSSINDFLGINEANLGINKSNYFVKRKVSQDVVISDSGTMSGQLKISYNNLSKKGAWPGGDYKNYLRLIFPQGTAVNSIAIGGEKQDIARAVIDFQAYEAKNFVPPNGLEVDTSEEEGKTVFGFLVIIPSERLKTITVDYSFPGTIDLNRPQFFYDLLLFKQPGVEEYPYSFSLTYPENILKVINLSEGLKDKEGKINFSSYFNQDATLHVDFSKL